jgi:chromosome segregation ATPase
MEFHGPPAPGAQGEAEVAQIEALRPQPDLSGELAEARKQAADARRQAADSRTALAEVLVQKQTDDLQIKELRAQITRQGDQFARDREKWTLMETKLTSLIGKAEQSAVEVTGELEKIKKELADAKAAGIKTPGDTEELKGLKARLAAAVRELKRQQDTFRAANAERDKAKHSLASLKARHQAALDQIRRVYLAAVAPGRTGLAALQEAMKRRGLLKRCVTLQRKARTDADKKLLARAEVALTRLGLLDLSDPSVVSAYITQLGRSDVIASLDAALGPLAADASTQDWLFETKLILTGVQRVI